MEYLPKFFDILKNITKEILNCSGDLKNLAEIIVLLIGGVCAIKGLNYLKILREKKATATFGFWTHLKTKLIVIRNRLSHDYNIINNFYSNEIKKGWNNIATPPSREKVQEFKKIIEETIEYIKSTSDQIPAYVGWTDDYTMLIEFLDDVIQFDIINPDSQFKFIEPSITIEERNQYGNKICNSITNLIKGIDSAQKKAEILICSDSEEI